MVDAPDIPRPSQLWKQLSAERRLLAAAAFWKDDSASMEQTEAVLAIANRIKFRVTSVLKMPREKKARQLVALVGVSEIVAAPPPETLQAGVKAIAAAYPADDVTLYLSTLIWQDPETWGGLADLPETR